MFDVINYHLPVFMFDIFRPTMHAYGVTLFLVAILWIFKNRIQNNKIEGEILNEQVENLKKNQEKREIYRMRNR